MFKRIKKRWVKGLKSGDYPQGRNHLKTPHGFCCLGVLTDLFIKEKKLAWVEDKNEGLFTFQSRSNFLPIDVMVWAGIKTDCPDIAGASAVYWNDKSGLNFKQIAEKIEEHL